MTTQEIKYLKKLTLSISKIVFPMINNIMIFSKGPEETSLHI